MKNLITCIALSFLLLPGLLRGGESAALPLNPDKAPDTPTRLLWLRCMAAPPVNIDKGEITVKQFLDQVGAQMRAPFGVNREGMEVNVSWDGKRRDLWSTLAEMCRSNGGIFYPDNQGIRLEINPAGKQPKASMRHVVAGPLLIDLAAVTAGRAYVPRVPGGGKPATIVNLNVAAIGIMESVPVRLGELKISTFKGKLVSRKLSLKNSELPLQLTSVRKHSGGSLLSVCKADVQAELAGPDADGIIFSGVAEIDAPEEYDFLQVPLDQYPVRLTHDGPGGEVVASVFNAGNKKNKSKDDKKPSRKRVLLSGAVTVRPQSETGAWAVFFVARYPGGKVEPVRDVRFLENDENRIELILPAQAEKLVVPLTSKRKTLRFPFDFGKLPLPK